MFSEYRVWMFPFSLVKDLSFFVNWPELKKLHPCAFLSDRQKIYKSRKSLRDKSRTRCSGNGKIFQAIKMAHPTCANKEIPGIPESIFGFYLGADLAYQFLEATKPSVASPGKHNPPTRHITTRFPLFFFSFFSSQHHLTSSPHFGLFADAQNSSSPIPAASLKSRPNHNGAPNFHPWRPEPLKPDNGAPGPRPRRSGIRCRSIRQPCGAGVHCVVYERRGRRRVRAHLCAGRSGGEGGYLSCVTESGSGDWPV